MITIEKVDTKKKEVTFHFDTEEDLKGKFTYTHAVLGIALKEYIEKHEYELLLLKPLLPCPLPPVSPECCIDWGFGTALE